MSTTSAQTIRPLSGIKVISLAEQFPGPYATLILGDLGADVVQVERPGHGDPSRAFPSFYEALNRGKRSVALDLKDPHQVDLCRSLIDTADVVIEGFRPGVLRRLGLGSEKLLRRRPELVYVSISGFGQDGPYRDRPAHDLSFQALAGLIGSTDETEPQLPLLSLADLTAGIFGAVAVTAGLASRQATGRGGVWDVSMFDGLLSLVSIQLSRAANGAEPEALGQDPGYGYYLTSDGRWLTLSIAFEDHFWRPLCAVLSLPQLADIDGPARVARRDELRSAVAERVASDTAASWEKLLTEADVPCGLVSTMDEIVHNPQVVAREIIHTVDDDRSVVRQPLVVDGLRLGPQARAPKVGEHTVEVLREIGINVNSIPG
jgi:crotonobetainyl-CoA:carnitine CoA-transferase CaiB-like acyl-CoA transferase